MARPRKFDELTVLNALRDVFWQRGYEGASYAHIMDVTGLKKGSLYATYGDKGELFKIAFKRYIESDGKEAIQILRDRRMSLRIKLGALFGSVESSVGTPRAAWGNFLCNAMMDPGLPDEESTLLVKDFLGVLTEALRSALPEDKQSKTEHILAAYFGAQILVKSGADLDMVCQISDSLLDDI